MEISSLMSSLTDSLSSKSRERSQATSQVAREFSSIQDKYKQAAQSGDEAAIAALQPELEAAGNKLKAMVELSSMVSRVIDSIISKIGQIGR